MSIYPPTFATEPIVLPTDGQWIEYIEIYDADIGSMFIFEMVELPLQPGYNKIVFADYLHKDHAESKLIRPNPMHSRVMISNDAIFAIMLQLINQTESPASDDFPEFPVAPWWNALYCDGRCLAIYVTTVSGAAQISYKILDESDGILPPPVPKDDDAVQLWMDLHPINTDDTVNTLHTDSDPG